MSTVAAVGLAVLDYVFSVPTHPERGRKTFATSLTEVGGGPAANAAVTVAALGGSARFVGRIGDDSIGDRIVADFARWGVDTSRTGRVAGVPSPISSVIVDPDGERTIVNHTDPRLHAADDVVTHDDLAGADAVLADLRWPAGATSALRLAAQLGIPSVLDFDQTSQFDDDVLALPTYIIFAAPALAAVAGTDDPSQGLLRVVERTGSWIGVTLGSAGIMWLNHGSVVHTPAFDVDTVDTLGAGDVFHGAFAHAVADGHNVDDALQRAAATAAIKCSRFGGRDGIPTESEVQRFLEGVRE
ncbi:MAG: PfkB family carbohydrate kinase [Actinomycetota bacterium]